MGTAPAPAPQLPSSNKQPTHNRQDVKKMTAFIKQEAMEKGREIEIKADEEFAIEKEYKEKTKKDVSASIDESNPLPDGCTGGVAIVGGNGKIEITNTFDERLKLLEDVALPSIRTKLFGPNENRKFYE